MPAISVLLPTYARNAEGRLAAAIESVLAQSFTDFDLWIVDDGSRDGSAETIAAFARRDARIRHVRFERNVGLPALTTARAFCESQGEAIAWMFDDCVWEPNALSVLAATLSAAPDALLAYARCRLRSGGGDTVIGAPLDRARLDAGDNHVPNCATLVRRSTYENLGWPDPHVLMVRFSDWDFWRRAAAHGPFAFATDIVAVEHGVALPNSLGNTVTVNPALLMRYAALDRRDVLRPQNWPSWRPLLAPPGFLQSVEEQEAFFDIAVEHLVRTGQIDRIDDVRSDPELRDVARTAPDAAAALAWWGDRKRRAAAVAAAHAGDLQAEVLRKQAFIDGQQAFIDQQEAFIASRLRGDVETVVTTPPIRIAGVTHVDIGCGRSKEDGYFGVDRFAMPGVDHVLDLEKDELPFETDSLDHIVTYHAIEHLRDYKHIIYEAYRVLKPNAQLFVCVPYWNTSLNIANVYHYSHFNEHSFRFFSHEPSTRALPEHIWAHHFARSWGLAASDNSSPPCNFRTLRIEMDYMPEYKRLPPGEQEAARLSRNNVVHNICFYLQAIKGPWEQTPSLDDSEIIVPPRRRWMIENDW